MRITLENADRRCLWGRVLELKLGNGNFLQFYLFRNAVTSDLVIVRSFVLCGPAYTLE